jgi:hypothetical protein
MRRALPLLTLVLTVTASHAGQTVNVTTCGQVVQRGVRGVLVGDLACGVQWGTCQSCATCSDEVQPQVYCSSPADCPDPGVNVCAGSRFYPGSVGVYVVPGGRLYLNGFTISGAQFGVLGNRPDGTGGSASVRVYGPGTIEATGQAFTGYSGRLQDVRLRASIYGIVATKARVKDVDTSGNTIGVSTYESLRALRLTSDDNRYIGLLSYGGARVSASHLTGNALVDVTTEDPPRVVATVCEHSATLVETGQLGLYDPSGPPWGVCSLDEAPPG